ncbi:MAG: hypothetical protein WBC44_05070 [Planctomycetaceae bacterium]
MTDFPTEDWWWDLQLDFLADLSPNWREEMFRPADAVEFQTDAGRISRRADAGLVGAGRIVPGGWDHEHCALCNTKLSTREGDETVGFTDGKNWVCRACFHQYVQPRFTSMDGGT